MVVRRRLLAGGTVGAFSQLLPFAHLERERERDHGSVQIDDARKLPPCGIAVVIPALKRLNSASWGEGVGVGAVGRRKLMVEFGGVWGGFLG